MIEDKSDLIKNQKYDFSNDGVNWENREFLFQYQNKYYCKSIHESLGNTVVTSFTMVKEN